MKHTSPWLARAAQHTLPASDRTIYASPPIWQETEDVYAVGTPRIYTAADLQRAYERECSAGLNSDDAAERVARSALR